ncbi:MAG: STAS domain-containing protein [Telmatospirillum sp.]|nr:STAS domain-containing protein [Telmatospirillum sp.]
MDFEIKDFGGASELWLRGRLTFDANVTFRTIFETLGKKHGQRITADISGLDFIDSAGLGMLLLLKEASGDRLTLRSPRGQVNRLLSACHFHTIVPVTDWGDAAMEAGRDSRMCPAPGL